MTRDSWSKMNVGLAKIFVHGELASEMLSNMVTTGKWDAIKTVELLKKLQTVFIEIFLNPTRRIYSLDDICFEQIVDANDFLAKWRHNVEVMGEKLNLSAVSQE
eukprot:Pompholyxophrys_punicea_v1_NODE_163_length_3053_cov_6.121081.p3 type:complete len:104 gc:universal NODE_163_length_3053_cov_6.121081:1079-768(-)